MREWHLTAADPIAPRLSADARGGRTTYTDDQTWRLQLGQPTEAALSLETRYGGRLGLARLVPIWIVDRRQIFEAQGYHSPPVLTAFAPDFVRLEARLTYALGVTFEVWVMESQAVGGRITITNSGDQTHALRLDLTAQAMREQDILDMLFLTLDNEQVALQMGRLKGLQPVLMMDGARDVATQARLSRPLTLEPGQQTVTRWVLGSLANRDASLGLAYKWLAEPDWDVHFAAIRQRADAMPQIETGHADWDTALAWSQQLTLRSFLAATGHLPHPSFVNARKVAQGFPLSGQHSAGFGSAWGGQTVPEALLIAGTVAQADPKLAQGLVRNFLAVQRDDGWIDAKPGLGGQRAGMIAPPLLATLAYTVGQITGDKAFLAECLPGLLVFFERWFKPDMDHNQDGLPEWSDSGQGAFADSPTFAQHRRWAQGVDITTVQAPDLAAYLVREADMLIQIAEKVGRDDVIQAIRPRRESLAAALNDMWDADKGIFHYRDRDTHACPTGEQVFDLKGDQPLSERTDLPQPSRLVLRVSGGTSRKPRSMSCTIEGVDGGGKRTHETIDGDTFTWYRGLGSATTETVWQAITFLKFDGLSRVFKIEGHTIDLTRHDMGLLMPLCALPESGALSDDQITRTVERLTDPDQYWAEYGVRACPKTDPAYDPQHRDGCGGMWPDWNARFGEALVGWGYRAESADLFRRVLNAQIASLKAEHAFHAFYNPETGEGLGDTDVLEGAVSLGWFGRLFGAFVRDAGTVVMTGPFAFADESITWTQHGVTVSRRADQTAITFPTGHTVRLDPDAAPQIVRDPKAKKR
ncbi:MAG: hypothetical protein JXQ72_15250 [Anaerolineae bacterium]|nr:hypothetical protein [Anaerolineae bacterium]